jgi:hypothetical protein
VDPVLDPLLLRKSGSAGNETWNSGHKTTEAVIEQYNLMEEQYEYEITYINNDYAIRFT